jgi:hypothetical protein
MLKIGVDNIIGTATLTGGNTNPSFPEDNAQEATLERWQSLSVSDTLTITFTAQQINHIAFFNVNIDTVTVTGKLSTATVFTDTYTQKSGIDVLNMYIPQTGNIDELVLSINNASSDTFPYVGYIWLGDEKQFNFEAQQEVEESNATREVSRGNIAEQNPGYIKRSIQMTIAKEEFSAQRSRLREIQRDWATPKSYVIDEDCWPTEVLLATLDSGRVQYDPFNIIDNTTGYKNTNATIGIDEVFGGSSR